MNLQKDKYIIVELIPTASTSEKGTIAQISALKIEGLKLLDRFDYRLNEELIENADLKELISYDKKAFNYIDNIYFIKEKFKNWSKDYPLLLVEEEYTLDYLKDLKNKKELVFPYLNLDYGLDVFERLKKKYGLEPSDHLVDLIYEAIIFEGNFKNKVD